MRHSCFEHYEMWNRFVTRAPYESGRTGSVAKESYAVGRMQRHTTVDASAIRPYRIRPRATARARMSERAAFKASKRLDDDLTLRQPIVAHLDLAPHVLEMQEPEAGARLDREPRHHGTER